MAEAYEPRRYTSQVMRGIAEAIAAAGLGVLRLDGSDYLPSERGIYFDYAPALAETRPAEILLITPYLPRAGMLAIEHTRIQLKARHVGRHPLWVRDYLDDVKALFPENTALTFGGHLFDRVFQQSSTTWGEEGRPGVSNTAQNFHLRGNRYEP